MKFPWKKVTSSSEHNLAAARPRYRPGRRSQQMQEHDTAGSDMALLDKCLSLRNYNQFAVPPSAMEDCGKNQRSDGKASDEDAGHLIPTTRHGKQGQYLGETPWTGDSLVRDISLHEQACHRRAHLACPRRPRTASNVSGSQSCKRSKANGLHQ